MNRRQSILAMVGGLLGALWPWKAAESASTVIWATDVRRTKVSLSCTLYRHVGTFHESVWEDIETGKRFLSVDGKLEPLRFPFLPTGCCVKDLSSRIEQGEV